MIVRKPLDMLVCGYSASTKFRVTFADVTETVHAIATFQNCGVASEYVLGGALVSTAIMGAEVSRPGESLGVRMDCDGAAMGAFTEISAGGAVRGYVRRKVLPEYDADPVGSHKKLMGDELRIQLFRARPGNEPDDKSVFLVHPPTFRNLVETYAMGSLQMPTWANVGVRINEQGVDRVVGYAVHCMPDGDFSGFMEKADVFTSDEALNRLMDYPVLETMREVLGLPDLEIGTSRELHFECSCSRERSRAMLSGLPLQDLEEMAASGDEQTITCHFCGSVYGYTSDEIREILAERKKA